MREPCEQPGELKLASLNSNPVGAAEAAPFQNSSSGNVVLGILGIKL
jgi:hypothetical protein